MSDSGALIVHVRVKSLMHVPWCRLICLGFNSVSPYLLKSHRISSNLTESHQISQNLTNVTILHQISLNLVHRMYQISQNLTKSPNIIHVESFQFSPNIIRVHYISHKMSQNLIKSHQITPTLTIHVHVCHHIPSYLDESHQLYQISLSPS